MKKCLKCTSLNVNDQWVCVNCGWTPEIFEGFPVFANEISGHNESYDPAWYPRLVELEENNFWFLFRNHLIEWFAKKHASSARNYLEIGCGSGFVLKAIQRAFPAWNIWATEAQIEGLKFAKSRVSSTVRFAQVDATAIPFREEFDIIGAFDVIEHIKNDEAVLKEINFSLKPKGLILLTVPQHMFLWSHFDEVGCHFRRYAWRELESKIINAGFEIVDSTSFNALLLPLMMLSRFTKKSKKTNLNVMDELELWSILNNIFKFVLWIEFVLVKWGVRWPVGGSRFVIARKK